MRKCSICLKSRKLWDTKCCNISVHYSCQVAWGNKCLICKSQLKTVSTKTYEYTPPEYEPTDQEILENDIIETLLARGRYEMHSELYLPLLRVVTEQLVEAYMSSEEDEIVPDDAPLPDHSMFE